MAMKAHTYYIIFGRPPIGGGKLPPLPYGGNVTSAGWQVTLCDPMWHVSSRSGVATLRTAIPLLFMYLLFPTTPLAAPLVYRYRSVRRRRPRCGFGGLCPYPAPAISAVVLRALPASLGLPPPVSRAVGGRRDQGSPAAAAGPRVVLARRSRRRSSDDSADDEADLGRMRRGGGGARSIIGPPPPAVTSCALVITATSTLEYRPAATSPRCHPGAWGPIYKISYDSSYD